MKTSHIIIIGIVSVMSIVVGLSIASPSINNFDDFVYQLKEPFDGAEPEQIAQPESEPRISGKMAQEICSITGGECPPIYPANIQEDGSKMTIVTTWDADTNTEKSFTFIIKNNTLSYDLHIMENKETCSIQCLVYDPVCGEDGITYACGIEDATCHGVKVKHDGECDVPEGISEWSGTAQGMEPAQSGKSFELATDFSSGFHCTGNQRCISGIVTRIIDGDTIQVNGDSIRFALASAPELDEIGGIDTRKLIEELCPVGSKVLVDQDDLQLQDVYGRVLGVVYCNKVNLNSELVESEYGYISTGFCKDSEFSDTGWAQDYGCSGDK